ncbi:helix-turn-helix domain-containing protein [Janibacter alkaliphilus]|uniref:Excisionase family DNA binding protein n=1 Tax=Janibacter alkaliphilus TaxID=1069963 RepID=A0A852WXM0_9MICO|nr:helix-turn-helix domain-containing protein [Janibacter alkaliphilus]NYG35536.1 excisionase family DNA binding protein [Janibacter alkaliphilus]
MAGAIAHEKAVQLREAVDEALRGTPEITDTARAAFARLLDVLESSDDAVVFPAEATISTSQAAALLGVSRMTVVRLVDRGDLQAETSAVHRRISVSELARYQAEAQSRRRSAMTELAGDVTAATPADRVIETR